MSDMPIVGNPDRELRMYQQKMDSERKHVSCQEMDLMQKVVHLMETDSDPHQDTRTSTEDMTVEKDIITKTIGRKTVINDYYKNKKSR